MIEPILRSRLEPLARRRRRWRLSRDLTICWAAAAGLGLVFYLVYRQTAWIPTWILPVISLAALAGTLGAWLRHRRWQPDFRQIAREIEQRHPELHALLLTAVEQQPDRETGRFHFLQERLITQAVQEGAAKTGWMDTVSQGQLLAMHSVQAAAFALLLLALSGLRIQTKEAVALGKPTRVQVTPGDTTIERGNSLAVLARFDGPLPPDVTLVIRPDAQPEQKMALVKSLSDPLFGGTIREVTNRLTYSVTYAGGHSPEYKVDVFEYPRLERADAHLVFPAYTGLAERTIKDTRRVSAVQGSTLDLSLQLNKPVASAHLVSRDKTVLPLVAPSDQANASLSKLTLKSSQIYDLVLVDAAGRTNKIPTQIVLNVLTNRAPDLTFISPRGDQRVSPLEEINFQGETSDDFGVKSYGITYSLAGQNPHTLVLSDAPVAANQKRQFGHVLRLEDLKAQPDQFLSYFIWADDIGPDGQLRRTASDMFYAEVRPFDEIFREGQSRSQSDSEEQNGQQGSESTRLADLEKQIMNATWKLQRENHVGLDQAAEPNRPKPSYEPTSAGYAQDIDVIVKSQDEALQRADSGKNRSQGAETKALWDKVEKQMKQAAGHLGKAAKSTEPLPAAVASEQAAYEALLQLASHEFNVSRGRRGRNSQSGQPNQGQLAQLDLKQSENRYEDQRQAAAQQNPQQREQLQVLSRLKELAQRQQDLNQRLQELQTALQAAQTEQEREQIRRQLKRLREEEQQMLADVDELLQRMNRPENQSRMADARQQLEQTRNQVQQASEMINRQSVGQALSSGTRAERQLADLRDQFRKQSSTEFSQEMRQMRSDARDLAQKEDQLSNNLKSMAETPRKTLSDSGETKNLIDQLGQQRQKMTNLMDQMTRVSLASEVSEPLLSKQLYDTLRKASQGNGDESLQKAGELLKMSFANDAAQFEQRAHQEINDIKQGVEKAAQSVLGDETEALRLARNELNDLENQVKKEMDQATQAGSQSGAQMAQPPNGPRPGGQRRGNTPGQPGQGRQNQPQQNRAGQLAQSGQGQSAQDRQNQQDQQNQNANRPGSAQNRSGRQPGAQAQAQSGSQQANQANANPSPGAQGQGSNPGQPRQQAALSGQPGRAPNGANRGDAAALANLAGEGGGEGGNAVDRRPITGQGYADWSDRLRDVEEMLDMPDLRNEVAGAREQARNMRIEFKKHAKPPQWDVVRAKIAQPLAEVRDRINDELARRESKDSLVPIDRDPVPRKFSELVRRYYEKLGSAEPAPPEAKPN
jgi:hypothetical protein